MKTCIHTIAAGSMTAGRRAVEMAKETRDMIGAPTEGQFWAKKEPRAGATTEWHSLSDHSADVGAAMEALLSLSVLNRRLAALGGLRELSAAQVQRLAALAALHDFGKFNHGFQNRAFGGPPVGHVGPALSLLTADSEWRNRLKEALGWSDFSRWTDDGVSTERLLYAAVCHHGRPIGERQPFDPRLWVASATRDPLKGLNRLASSVREWFPLGFAPGADPLPVDPPFQHGFSGCVMLADWIASDRAMFAFASSVDSDRIRFARDRIGPALRALGLDVRHLRQNRDRSSLEFLAIHGVEPRPLQAHVDQLPVTPGGSLVLVEAETGSGKTEAALQRFFRLFAAGEVDGIYFALPTRSAASQIHARVTKAVKTAFGAEAPGVILALPGYLRVDEVEGRALPNFAVQWPDEDPECIRHRGWAAENPKRYLAGAFVVGTIDQALLSQIQVAHAHLRAAALRRHLLVVDEVHASDEYMSSLLVDLIRHHVREAKGHALLMSATLGSTAASAILEDADSEFATAEEAVSVAYPRIVYQGDSGATRLNLAIEPSGAPRRVRILLRPIGEDPEAIAREAVQASRLGARVLVLRNTVRDAVNVQRELEACAGPDSPFLFACFGRPAPHHSRFAHEDRRLLDRAVEERFGKGSPIGGGILVSTQTIEQSLDVDFDLLLTDLCPADVLLQRLGRLHRHRDRSRPEGFREAVVQVLVPAERQLSTWFRRRPGTGTEWSGSLGWGSVYDNVLAIEATWRALERRAILDIPEHNRWLVETATHRRSLSQLAEALGSSWADLDARTVGRAIARQGAAGVNRVQREEPFGSVKAGFPADASRPPTRLGGDDRVAGFPGGTIGPFGQPISRIRIPGHQMRHAKADWTGQARLTAVEGGEVGFEAGGVEFVYGRWGLRRAE